MTKPSTLPCPFIGSLIPLIAPVAWERQGVISAEQATAHLYGDDNGALSWASVTDRTRTIAVESCI